MSAAYYASVLLLLVVLPMATHLLLDEALLDSLVLFSSLRLALAGVVQMRNPAYTAETLFGLSGERRAGALPLVRELGGANLAKGVLGVVAPFVSEHAFVEAAALAVGLFYAVAGLGHAVFHAQHRNSARTFAMVTDFGIALALLTSWWWGL